MTKSSGKLGREIVRTGWLALCILAGGFIVSSVGAQGQSASGQSSSGQSSQDQSSQSQGQSQAQSAQEQSSEPQASPAKPQVKQDRSPGPPQQLVRESRKAAGEEKKDETEAFKQSSSVQLIAKWTGLGLRQAYWLSVITNFVVIAAIIFWAGRKTLPGFFRDRTASIQKAMQEAQKASEEARRKLAEIDARLSKLDGEIDAMREAAEKEGADEAARIQAAAQEDARKIVAAAEQEIAAAAKSARRALTAHAADLAVGLAQKQIHVDATTDQGLVRTFTGQLTTASDHLGKGEN